VSYIERLQEDKRLLVEYFNLSNELEDKITMSKNTAYPGDALRAVQETRNRLIVLRESVWEMLNRKQTKKEAVNA
jgi:hypothetical protein